MFDLSHLKDAKAKSDKNLEAHKEKYQEVVNNAIEIFEKSFEARDEEGLKKSAEEFNKALDLMEAKTEPYLYLSVIYHCFGESQVALEYFKHAEQLEPAHPELENARSFLEEDPELDEDLYELADLMSELGEEIAHA